MIEDRRLIEEQFPIEAVGEEAAREKYIRHGHICTLHTWWARRPLASSRATSYASLIPAIENEEERERTHRFIGNLAKWENSLNNKYIQRSRKDILQANGGIPPRVLDPFAGGGAIPLEAQRLGCEVFSSDLNPVAVLLQKCTLEYPQKYGHTHDSGEGLRQLRNEENPLLADVEKWAKWILSEAEERIGQFYSNEKRNQGLVGYLWARTIPCQNPSCNVRIPLIRQYWLARRKKKGKWRKKVSLCPYLNGDRIDFRIVGDGYASFSDGFNPSEGTVSRAVVTCPSCGTTIDADTTRHLFKSGQNGQRLTAVIEEKRGDLGYSYRIPNKQDISNYEKTQHELREILEANLRWGISPIPDEPTPIREGSGAERAFSLRNYGLDTWGDLFNQRQKLSLLTFTQLVRLAYEDMVKNYEEEYARVVATYLAIILDRLVDKSSTLVRYGVARETTAQTFSRAALSMIWDYVEVSPFTSIGWPNMVDWVLRNIEHLSTFDANQAFVSQNTATNLPFESNSFDAVFTDPPYYDNVPYSYLSDFFYVWLKRSIGYLYPELFSTPLTPKSNEIVAYSKEEGGLEAGKEVYNNLLKKSFMEIQRVLKPGGIAVIVYAHKETKAWETLIDSLLSSNLVMTAAWPINTEMGARMRAMKSAALSSSIYIVTRKLKRKQTGFYRDIKHDLDKHLAEKLEELWNTGISGADFFVASIASAMEIFGEYQEVIDYEGKRINPEQLLGDVRKFVTDYVVRQILQNGFSGELSGLSQFYLLYRWNYGTARVPFDEARKLAQSCGIDLTAQWNRSFVRKHGKYIRAVGPHKRNLQETESSSELIDVLHRCVLLWEKGKDEEIEGLLRDSRYGDNEAFWRFAQAISETLSNKSKEKKLLDGFLASKDMVQADMVQERLD